MAKDYLQTAYADVGRKDRAIDDDAWIVAFLRRAPMAQLATVHDGQPFIHSNLFAYDETVHAVYMHTAPVGRTRSNVESDERACVSVSEIGRLLPSHEALTMSVEYDGAAIFGRARVLSDDAERERGLRLILDKYFPHLAYGDDYRAITPEELARTTDLQGILMREGILDDGVDHGADRPDASTHIPAARTDDLHADIIAAIRVAIVIDKKDRMRAAPGSAGIDGPDLGIVGECRERDDAA